jgi:hypothetical protein
VLYKRISEQKEYIKPLIPEVIVRKTRIEIEDKGCLKLVLQWFKKDFMQWVPKDQKCEICNLLMSFHFVKGIHGKCEIQRSISVAIVTQYKHFPGMVIFRE